MELHDNYDKRDKTQELIEKSVTNELGDLDSEKPTAKQSVYVDMGGVLMERLLVLLYTHKQIKKICLIKNIEYQSWVNG